ncbi:MAG: radical SAM protein [Candidatus Omnitrophica bacterium]|nr:radical SAM protein [Candidatus Omnitrophota bacterium]
MDAQRYFYGPVPSRRLGYSLGVDVIPKKLCPFDCVYCQTGRTTEKTIERVSFVNTDRLKKELIGILAGKATIDVITFSGSGEPTLHQNLDRIIAVIREVCGRRIPVCVITNSSLLFLPEVRRELAAADIVIPSLDAPNEALLRKINRPCAQVNFERIVEGLVKFRAEFEGRFWLEIMIVKGINDSPEAAAEWKGLIQRIRPDKVQLNIPVRPSQEHAAVPDQETLRMIQEVIGEETEVVLPFEKQPAARRDERIEEEIVEYLRRRPATLADLCASTGAEEETVRRVLEELVSSGRACGQKHQGVEYFRIND